MAVWRANSGTATISLRRSGPLKNVAPIEVIKAAHPFSVPINDETACCTFAGVGSISLAASHNGGSESVCTYFLDTKTGIDCSWRVIAMACPRKFVSGGATRQRHAVF